MRNTITFSLNKSFMAGWLSCYAINSLQQDYWGMEGTVRHVVNGWMPAWITVPIAIGVLVIALALCHDPKPAEAE